MRLKKLLIAEGNSTLLVWDCPSSEKSRILKKYLGEVEQIGFISRQDNGPPKLTMMGNELSINGTIAFASQLGKKGKLITSGITSPVFFSNINGRTTIELELGFKKLNNTVVLEGIGFILLDVKPTYLKKTLKDLAIKYNLPAFGSILYKERKLNPFVYVKDTNSLFRETACGSGSISLNILTGLEKVLQPTGETIIVKRTKNRFTVEAKVVTIGESYE